MNPGSGKGGVNGRRWGRTAAQAHWSSVCSVRETKARAVFRERGAPGQELFVVVWVCFSFGFLFFNGEKALSRFKCWCNESIERQGLKTEKGEIIQQIFLRHLLCAW